MKTNQSQKNIQKDWKQLSVGEVFTFVKSYAYSRDNLTNGLISKDAIGNIHYGDIHSTYNSPNIDVSKIEIPLIKDRDFNPDKNTLLKDGDLVMSDASEDYEGVGVTVSIHGIGNKKVVGGLHTFVLRDEKGLTNEYYRQYIFRNPEIRNTMQKIANGVSVYGISKTTVSKIKLPLPPLSEQNRIVSVLETWDKTIEKLSKKIEVKKQLKISLMQGLLTGKVRLPGFVEKWKTISLGDVLKERNERDVESDKLLLYSLTIEDGVCPKGERYDRSFLVKSDSKVYKKTYKNDIVYNPANLRYGAIAHNKNENPVLLSPIYQVLFIKNEKETNIDFIGQLLTWERQIRKMSAYAEGTLIERMEVKIDSFKTIQIDIPNKKEQDAIASVLNTANKEITLLEEKLLFIQEQKRYLLNNLITGTIRTPETLSTKLTK